MAGNPFIATKFRTRGLILTSLGLALVGPLVAPARADNADDSAKIDYARAETYYQFKQWPDAVTAYQKFLALKADMPDRPYAAAHLGDAEFNLKAYSDAADAFQKAIAESKDAKVLAYCNYWLAESYMAQKDTEKALAAYTVVVEQYPESDMASYAFLARGVCLAELKRNKEAAVAFQQFLDKFPKNDGAAEAAYSIGDVDYADENYAGAEVAFQKVLDLYPKSDYAADATENLAWARRKLKKWSTAAPLFDVAAQAPGNAHADDDAYEAGYAWLQWGDSVKAQASWKNLLADPAGHYHADVLYLLAKFQYDHKQYAQSVDSFQTFVKAHPAEPRVYAADWAIGTASLLQADKADRTAAPDLYKAALDAYTQALKGLADHPDLRQAALQNMVIADDKLGDSAAASTVRVQLKKEFPASAAAKAATLVEADNAFAAKRYPEALAGYQEFVKAHPDDPKAPDASYRIGICQLKSNDLAAASATFTTLANDHPDYEAAAVGLLSTANAYFNLHKPDYASADPLYSLILDKFPQSEAEPLALYAQASGYANSGTNLGVASDDFARLVREHPKDPNAPEAMFGIAWIHEKQGEKVEAVEGYRKFLAAYPNDTRGLKALQNMSACLTDLKKTDEAMTVWDQIAQRYPKDPAASRALLAKSAALVDLKRPTDAIVSLTALVTDFPDSPDTEDALFDLGLLKLNAKDNAGAIVAFDQVIAKYPQGKHLGPALFGDATARYQRGDYLEAGPLFKKAADISVVTDPKDPQFDAGFWAGQSFLKAKKYDQALPMFQGFLAKGSKTENAATAANGAAKCQQALGQFEEAIALYGQAASMDQRYEAEAACGKGECLLALKRPAEAKTKFVAALPIAGDAVRVESQLGLGEALEALQQWDPAAQAYQDVIDSKTAGALADEARRHLAAIRLAHPAH